MSEEEIEELKKREEKEVKVGEEGLKSKAKKQFFNEVRDWIADESMERLKELIKEGMLVEELYEKKREEEFENAIQALRIEKTKVLALKILIARYLRGEIDKYDFARRILAITHAEDKEILKAALTPKETEDPAVTLFKLQFIKDMMEKSKEDEEIDFNKILAFLAIRIAMQPQP